jgi:hypothetical protein
MTQLDTTKAERKLLKAANDAAEKRLGAAAFRKPFTDGLSNAISLGGGNWAPNAPEWLERKKKKGWGTRPWVRTGSILQAISDNPPTPDLKTQRRVRFGINRRGAFAFAAPRAFKDSRGKRFLKLEQQERVLTSLKRGSAIARLRRTATMRGRTFLDVIADSFGISDRDRARGKAGAMGVPARPLLFWRRDWRDTVERDVQAAVVEILRAEGLSVK